MSAKSQLSLLLCYMALLLSVAAAMPVRQQPIQQQRAYPSAPAATVPVHAQAAAEWQNDASTQQAMQDNAQILTQMQQRLQQQQAQAVQSAYQQYAQRTSTPTSLQTAAAAPADPMMEPQYIEPQMRGYSSGYASSVGSPCSRYDASGACDPSASVEMRAATGAPTSQIPSSIRARTAAVGEPADSEDALERPYSDRFGGDNSESKPYADDRKQSPPKPAAAEPPVEKDWRTACAQRCEERNMDVTGVGVQAISTDKAEVRATIEHRKMVNTTLTEGTLQPMELAQLINEVQTQVSTKAAAVVEFLQTDPKISPSISKLRTSGQCHQLFTHPARKERETRVRRSTLLLPPPQLIHLPQPAPAPLFTVHLCCCLLSCFLLPLILIPSFSSLSLISSLVLCRSDSRAPVRVRLESHVPQWLSCDELDHLSSRHSAGGSGGGRDRQQRSARERRGGKERDIRAAESNEKGVNCVSPLASHSLCCTRAVSLPSRVSLAGVTRIEGITFVASPKELNAARHIAIQSAVEDAIEQALVSKMATEDERSRR